MKRIAGVVLLLVFTVAPGWASSEAGNLKGLKQLRVEVAGLPAEAAMGISGDTLEAEVRGRLRSELPRVTIHQGSQSHVYVRVTMLRQAAVPELEPACTTLVELQVHRPVTVLNDELGPEVAVTLVPVWEKSVLLGGGCNSASAAIKSGLEPLLKSLIADYATANR